MSSLYSASNITLNQTGSTITFSNATVGLNNVSLILNSGSNWTQTANHSLYNVVYVEGQNNKGLNFGPSEPLIIVIEKATDSSNNLLKIHEFELSFDRLSAKQIDATVSTTPVGLASLEQYYDTDLNKNSVISNYGVTPKNFQLEELSSGFVFDFSYLETVSQTGLTHLMTPLKVSAGTSWVLNSASESVFYSLAHSITGSSASESTLELKVLTDTPSASITGGFSALDGFSVNSFVLDAAGTQFTLYNSASATSANFSIFEHNIGQDLNTDGVIGHAFSTANGVVSASTYSPSYQLNNKSAGSSFLFGSAFSSNHTIFQTSGEIVSFNGNFYKHDFLVLGNDGAGVFGYSHFSTEDQKAGLLPIKPDVILMNGVNPWQPASFVSPTTTLQSAGTLPSAHGVLAISAAAGAGGITFATNFHNDVYVFQATTATNVSTTLSIFENPYYFEFEPSASQISSVATAAPIFQLGQSLSISGDILAVVEKNIGENVNNDSVTGAISATQVLASTAYTTNITTSSGQISLSANSPALFSGQGGFLIWNQSSGVTNSISDTANDNEYFIIAESDLSTWSASGTLVLTGAYRETPEITGQQAQVSAGTQNLVQNTEDAISFSIVYDTQTNNSFGSVYSVYTFTLHTALDSVAVWNSAVSSFAVRDLESFETTLGYDITGDGIVGNSGLAVQSIIASKTGLATANSAQSTNLLKLESGEFAIGNETPQVGQPTTGKLLVNSSSTSWSPSSGASAIGVYGNVLDSNSATESYVVVQKSGTDTSPEFGLWTFSSDTSLLSLQTNQSTATNIELIDLVSYEMQLGFDITGDTKVGDQISEVVLSSSTMQIDSNNDGVLDSTKVIPAVIKSSLGFIGVDYDTNTAVGNSQPFIILKDSSGSAWGTSLNYEVSGIYQSEVVNNQSTIAIIEKSGSTLNPFYQKWSFTHQSGFYTAQVSASTATRLTISEVIAEEQTYNVDLDGNGTIGDDIERYLFLVANQPSLVQTQVGNYAISFGEVLGANDLGLPILMASSGSPWVPTRGNSITGVFAERSGSAQTISIIENAGSSFAPAYKKWEFNLSDGSFFATAQTTLAVSVSSAKLGGLETRKNIDLLADGFIGDPIKSVIVSGGETSLDADNDGFADGTVTAPGIILTKSNAYALDLSGAGNVGETVTSLFLEASNGENWNPSTNYTIVGGYVSYDVNTSSEQTTSAFVYEKSGSGSSAIYKEWHFVQGSSSGVATATSGIAQTIPLTDILTKELERGFDLTNDNVVGDRIVDLTKQLSVPQRGAPSVVELASGSYAVDFDGNSTVGMLKSVINLKTSSGQNWSPSQGSEVIGIFSSEELESSGQIKYYATVFEQIGTGSTSSFRKWVFSKPSGQADFQASAATSTVVTLTDILIDESRVGFDLNADGAVGDVIADITWQVPPVDTEVSLNVPQVVQLTSGAYGLDIEGDLSTGSTTPVVILSKSTGANWQPTSGSTVTGVYLSIGGTTASPTNLSTIIEKSGLNNFPTFKTWTFTDSGDGSKAVATVTDGQSITESALLQKELEVGYDLNGDEVVGDGIFSIALLSKDYLGTDQQVLNSPGVVRLSSGEFGLVFGGNDYSTENGRSFLLKEIESNGNAWTPFSNPSSDGRDYSISGVELVDNGDLKIYEVKESANGDPDVKVTTFTLSESSPESYFVKNNQSDSVAISDSEFFNRELEIGYNLDSNHVLGPGAEEITISPKSFMDKFGVNQKSPSLAKLADGSVAIDFIGDIQLGETPKLILNQGAQPFRYSLDEQVQGLYTSTETNDATNQVIFNVNVLQKDSNTNSDSFFLRTFNVVDDSLAKYDNTKALQLVTLTEVLSKEEMVGYDLTSNGQVGFQNRELLMPAFSTSPGPDDFRLVRTETSAIGLDSAITITPENDQYFYSLYDSSGSLWGLDNETVTGVFLEDRTENTEGEDTNVQLRTQSSADTILGVVTNPAGGSVTSTSNFNLWEFVISGDATPNALGLYEFQMISANAARYSLDELSIVESDKGFDLTGDRQVLGDTAVELFREEMVLSNNAREMVSGELTGLPDAPVVSEIASELLMSGVSLQTENISYGNLTSGLKKGTVNSFVSNGNISLNFSDISIETTSAQSQSNVSIDAQIELSYYSLDEPLSEESDLVHFVALGGKERAASSFQAIADFTNVLEGQRSFDESGAPIVASKMKLFDFSGNNPEEVDSDEIILQLAESEGVVLLAPHQTSGASTFVNINNETGASASEILLIGEFSVRGGEGKQTFVGDDSKQDLSLGSGDDIVFAGGGDDVLIASDGNNYFDGGGGNDEISAGSGMDIFVGGSGDDIIDGGDGFDKAEYAGSFYDFTIEKQLDSFSVNDRLSLEGTDTLTNVERLEFADGTLAFDTNGNAGQAYRLYQAAFERTPDPVGVGYHVNDIESNGLVLYQIAGNFLASPEFENTYGSNLNDSDFVDALYDNVLGRSPDEFEREYYLDRFNKSEGDPLWMDRAASLIGFSESPENMNIVNDDILNGIWMTNDYM